METCSFMSRSWMSLALWKVVVRRPLAYVVTVCTPTPTTTNSSSFVVFVVVTISNVHKIEVVDLLLAYLPLTHLKLS